MYFRVFFREIEIFYYYYLFSQNYPTYKSVEDSEASIEDMDIFRVERLWINEKGERFAFGHHYLRPHETFHEPTRKFFRNEVFRVPIYEVLPLDTIWKQCWVLDLPTFCKGRPRGALEEHIYICEYRVDKTARLFHRISKPKVPVCTKWFAFDIFDLRLKPSRNYTVSGVLYFFILFTQRAENLYMVNRYLQISSKCEMFIIFSSLMKFLRNGKMKRKILTKAPKKMCLQV